MPREKSKEEKFYCEYCKIGVMQKNKEKHLSTKSHKKKSSANPEKENNGNEKVQIENDGNEQDVCEINNQEEKEEADIEEVTNEKNAEAENDGNKNAKSLNDGECENNNQEENKEKNIKNVTNEKNDGNEKENSLNDDNEQSECDTAATACDINQERENNNDEKSKGKHDGEIECDVSENESEDDWDDLRVRMDKLHNKHNFIHFEADCSGDDDGDEIDQAEEDEMDGFIVADSEVSEHSKSNPYMSEDDFSTEKSKRGKRKWKRIGKIYSSSSSDENEKGDNENHSNNKIRKMKYQVKNSRKRKHQKSNLELFNREQSPFEDISSDVENNLTEKQPEPKEIKRKRQTIDNVALAAKLKAEKEHEWPSVQENGVNEDFNFWSEYLNAYVYDGGDKKGGRTYPCYMIALTEWKAARENTVSEENCISKLEAVEAAQAIVAMIKNVKIKRKQHFIESGWFLLKRKYTNDFFLCLQLQTEVNPQSLREKLTNDIFQSSQSTFLPCELYVFAKYGYKNLFHRMLKEESSDIIMISNGTETLSSVNDRQPDKFHMELLKEFVKETEIDDVGVLLKEYRKFSTKPDMGDNSMCRCGCECTYSNHLKHRNNSMSLYKQQDDYDIAKKAIRSISTVTQLEIMQKSRKDLFFERIDEIREDEVLGKIVQEGCKWKYYKTFFRIFGGIMTYDSMTKEFRYSNEENVKQNLKNFWYSVYTYIIRAPKKRRCLCLYGENSTGKSTIVNMLSEFFTNVAHVCLNLSHITSFTYGCGAGKQLVIMDDVNKIGFENLDVLGRSLLDGNPVQLEQKYKQPATYVYPPILITTNETPDIFTPALKHRIISIKFNNQIPDCLLCDEDDALNLRELLAFSCLILNVFNSNQWKELIDGICEERMLVTVNNDDFNKSLSDVSSQDITGHWAK